MFIVSQEKETICELQEINLGTYFEEARIVCNDYVVGTYKHIEQARKEMQNIITNLAMGASIYYMATDETTEPTVSEEEAPKIELAAAIANIKAEVVPEVALTLCELEGMVSTVRACIESGMNLGETRNSVLSEALAVLDRLTEALQK